jgi:hypothetical protein
MEVHSGVPHYLHQMQEQHHCAAKLEEEEHIRDCAMPVLLQNESHTKEG